jgi:hypothetical protein
MLVSSVPCLAGPIEDLDAKEFCTGDLAPVSKMVLARAIVDAYKVPIKLVDWKDTGIGYDQYANIVSTPLCAGGMTQGKCSDKNITLQNNLVTDLGDALNRKPRLQKAGDTIELPVKYGSQRNGATLVFKLNRLVSPLDRKRYPMLDHLPLPGHPDYSLPAQVFLIGPDHGDEIFSISCRLAKGPGPGQRNAGASGAAVGSTTAAAVGDPAGGTYGWPPPQQQPTASAYILDHLRLRASTDDLDIGRGNAAFGGLASASLAASSDRIAAKTTFDVHSVVGYVLPSFDLVEGFTLDSIPFFKFDRDYVETAKVPPNSNVDNIGLGLRESLTFPIAQLFYNRLTAQPQYIFSVRQHAEIMKFNAVYEPEPLWPYFGYAAASGLPGFNATVIARGVLNIAHVTEMGNDRTLLPTNNYGQGGMMRFPSLATAHSVRRPDPQAHRVSSRLRPFGPSTRAAITARTRACLAKPGPR